MNQLSTEVFTHKAITFDGKEINLTTKKALSLMKAKSQNPTADVVIGKSSYKLSDIRRVEEIIDTEKENEMNKKVKDHHEALQDYQGKTIQKHESRLEAKKIGFEGKAWECDVCGWWNPYKVSEDTSREYLEDKNRYPYKADFKCIYCNK